MKTLQTELHKLPRVVTSVPLTTIVVSLCCGVGKLIINQGKFEAKRRRVRFRTNSNTEFSFKTVLILILRYYLELYPNPEIHSNHPPYSIYFYIMASHF